MRRALPGIVAAFGLLPPGAARAAAEPPAFKILVEQAGAYRVRFSDLGTSAPLPTARLGITCDGAPVPVWVEDGGDGAFGPGDWIEFLGERRRGEVSYFSELTRDNVYWLRFDLDAPGRMRRGSVPAEAGSEPAGFRTRLHLEQDRLMLRLPGSGQGDRDELWYWAKLTQDPGAPYVQPLALDALDAGRDRRVRVRVGLRGWSRQFQRRTRGQAPQPASPPDHRVVVSVDALPPTVAEWSDTGPYVVELPPIPASRLRPEGGHAVSVRVPARLQPDGTPLIDVVMLNWIEVDSPRTGEIGDAQARLELERPGGEVRLDTTHGRRLVAYGAGGTRVGPEDMAWTRDAGRASARFAADPREGSFVVSDPDRLLSPAAVLRDAPSGLASPDNRADYLMVVPGSLRLAVEPLAAFHRGRGLAVEVVDVQDVFDEFSYGVTDPEALRSFVAYAYHHWRPPAPRFVLLVGDASWDAKNERSVDVDYADWTYRPGEAGQFVKNESTPYAVGAEENRRGLIPTWNYLTPQGHAASDAHFVEVDGDDALPDLAIGRLAVVSPLEVSQIVDKILAYSKAPEPGPWRRRMLFVTNEARGTQRQSDRVAGRMAAAGYVSERVYPASSETTNADHTRRLVEAFSAGELVVHFLGHGGRYVWRTGPPDYSKNHDLFTLDDLDAISPTRRLPIVISLTCYSAPFDHPSADSIGEKLLRLEDRGAVAVVAASWRNNPSAAWGEALLRELTRPGATVGEALLRAKREVAQPMFVETYNLLGDPALPVARPAGQVEVQAEGAGGDGALEVRGSVGEAAFRGQVRLDLLDLEGHSLATRTLETRDGRFAATFTAPAAVRDVATVQAYAWDARTGWDAVGGLALVEPAEPGGRLPRPRVGRAGTQP